MKRVVLYAFDFEPITILEIHDDVWNCLDRYGIVRLDVPVGPSAVPVSENVSQMAFKFKCVTIRAERIRRNHDETLMLFTHDESSALLLQAAFLPGQVSAIQAMQSNAFAHGFLHALRALK